MDAETVHTTLRIPAVLLAQLDAAARGENRTRTQEIVLRLRRSLEPSRQTLRDAVAEYGEPVEFHARSAEGFRDAD